MNITKPSYEILTDLKKTNFLENIEIAARACYKSEDKIKDGSAEQIVKMLVDKGHMAMIEHAPSISVKFTSNRGFTHEIVRMRLASFAQTSTRYVNYSREKFGSSISVCMPDYIERQSEEVKKIFIDTWGCCQDNYMKLTVDHKIPAQIARDLLPIGIEADIIVTCNLREWKHILELRTANVAHPIMHEIMRPLLNEFQENIPVIFDGVCYE